MPILFTGNGKVWKDQELAAAIHYLTPSPPLSPHTSLTHSTNLLQSPNHLPLPLPNKNPKAVKGMWVDLLQELVVDLGVVSV